MSDQQIPKIIHYCWFGGNPLPELAQKCIASWKKFCPDYEIKEWNESNYDVRKIQYTAQAYDAKKYAFVSDYARFDILYKYGGVYLDTDVELIKSLDKIIKQGAFCGVEQLGALNTGLGMATPTESQIFREILDSYQSDKFINTDGSFNLKTVVTRVSDILKKHGFSNKDGIQEIAGFRIYPTEYFCPKSYLGEINLTENTYSIHHFGASWQDISKTSGIALIRRNYLDNWGVSFSTEEEKIYSDILKSIFDIKTLCELHIALNMMEKIFSAGEQHVQNDNLYKTVQFFIFKISESGIQNNVTSLKLYFTTFRKWKIFETPRANLRYIYHCLRNMLHV